MDYEEKLAIMVINWWNENKYNVEQNEEEELNWFDETPLFVLKAYELTGLKEE